MSVPLQAQLSPPVSKFGSLVLNGVDIALIHEQRDTIRGMKEAVTRRLEQLSFEAKGGERIRIFNPATAPGSPISDSRFKYMAMTPVGVLGTVLGLVLLLEIRSARV